MTVVLCFAWLQGGAEEIIASGTCGAEGDGSNVTWTLTADSVLIISGEGEMGRGIPQYAKEAIVETGVTKIGANAFTRCELLELVTLPNSVTAIERHAFSNCRVLKTITLSQNLENIGEGAFTSCYELQSIILPEKLKEIGPSAFYRCESLQSIVVPNNVTTIGGSAFQSCKNLISISLSEKLTSIGALAFMDCRTLTSITIPNGVTTIGGDAFNNCDGLTSITFPESVTTIGASICKFSDNLETVIIKGKITTLDSYSFQDCPNLTLITLPNSLTKINGMAFKGCSSLASINIPEQVTSIGNSAFAGCGSLTSITLPKGLKSVGGSIFSGCSNLEVVTLPDGLTSVGEGMFNGCSSLTSIAIPSSVTSIGGSAFAGCSSLASITIPDNVTSIGASAFGGCEKLTSITIPDGVTTIENWCFSACSELSSVTLPDNVTLIRHAAFEKCKKLSSITLPSNLKVMESAVFLNCNALTSVNLPSGMTAIGSSAFANCSSLTSINIPENVTAIDVSTFEGCSSLQSVSLASKDKLTAIRDKAFNNCTQLKDFEIPQTISELGGGVFQNTAIQSATIPDGIEKIGNATFADCKELLSITLPASITKLDDHALGRCTQLTDFYLYAENPPALGMYALDKISSNMRLHVPAFAVSVYEETPGYSHFDIMPLPELVTVLQVNLPAESKEVYQNMILELKNEETEQIQKLVVSERMSYSFRGLARNESFTVSLKTQSGGILGEIKHIRTTEEEMSVTFDKLLSLHNVSLQVLLPDKTDVTGQVKITWSDTMQGYLSQGDVLPSRVAGEKITYSVGLNQTLGTQYVAPADSTFKVKDGDNHLQYTLQLIKQVTLSGKVQAEDGSVLSGATVSVTQKLNGKYSKNFTGRTDAEGAFSVQVYDDESTVSVSFPGYINHSLTVDDFTAGTDLGVITLKPITGTTVHLTLTYTSAIAESETAETQSGYADYANVVYTVYNETQGKEVTEFAVQYPDLVLLEETAEGDRLRITASSLTDAFAPVEATATVNADDEAEATLPIVAWGGIEAAYSLTDNDEVVGILYDSRGELVAKQNYLNTMLSFANVPDGAYTLVSMASSKFFNSILKLSQLSASGLTEGTDYVRNELTVQSGRITSVLNDIIPTLDESKLYYTGANTSFTVNKSSVVAGNYLTLKSTFDFKPEYAASVSDVRLVVDLPEGTSFVENSVMAGSSIVPYILDDNRLTVALSDYREQVRFCVIPITNGEQNPNAFVEFSLEERNIQQPIGAACYIAKGLTFSVPSTVTRTTLPLSGTARAGSAVEIYDNDILIGQTTVLGNGTWRTACDLYEPHNLSKHSLYVKVTTTQGLKLQSQTKEVLFDKNGIEVSKVTMINVAHPATSLDLCEYVTVFDFQNPPASIPAYWYWPSYPDFTFLIEFVKPQEEKPVELVNLDVITEKQEVVRLKALYDKEKKAWIANQPFYSGNLPVNVKVNYSVVAPEINEDGIISVLNANSSENGVYEGKFENLTVEKVSDSKYKVEYDCDENAEFKLLSFENLGAKHIIEYLRQGTEHRMTYNISSVNIIPDKYIYLPLYANYSLAYLLSKEQGTLIYNVIFPSALIKDLATHEGEVVKEEKTMTFLTELNKYTQYDYVLVSIVDEAEYLTKAKSYAHTTINRMTGMRLDRLKEYCNEDLVPQDRLDYIRDRSNRLHRNNQELNDFTEALDEIEDPLGRIGRRHSDKNVRLSANAASAALELSENAIETGRVIGNWSESFDMERDLKYYEGLCGVPPLDGDPMDGVITPNAPYVMDPSGFVYEAVESNRLQGVTATCYQKQMVEDMYGDLHEEITVWDAENYGQENPLVTDEMGMYRWDVPQGLWQVKFEKPGYETTYSEWLPVPPPQLDVNIAMVQAVQPEVEAVCGYETGIEIDFCKFMQPATLTEGQITVTHEGAALSGEVVLQDEEADPLDETKRFASKVRFELSDPLKAGDKVLLTVSREATSYAGVQMAEDYMQEIVIEKEPQTIVAADVEVVYGRTSELTVSINPAEAAAGKKLAVHTASSMIVTVTPAEAVLDAAGQAVFTVKGELPGRTVLQLEVEGMNMKAEVEVNVVQPTTIAHNYHLSMGWNWISINVEDALLDNASALLNPIKDAVISVHGEDEALAKDEAGGLQGTLTAFRPGQSYKVELAQDAALTLTGVAVMPDEVPIDLHEGWNWIGYPLTDTLSVGDALQHLEAEENEVVKGQDCFAVYDGSRWIGNLAGFVPGEGYMYYAQSAKSFLYPEGVETVTLSPSVSPQWSYNAHEYADNMTMVARLYVGEQLAEAGRYVVGAFAGSICRGVAVEQDGYFFLTIHGEQLGERIGLKAFDRQTGEEYIVQERMEFSDLLKGSCLSPVDLHIEASTGFGDIQSGWLLYPNPVHDRLYIRSETGENAEIHIANTNGQVCIVSEANATVEGIDVSALPAGLYLLTLDNGTETVTYKFVKR